MLIFYLFPQDVYVGTEEETELRNENEDEGNIFDIFADCKFVFAVVLSRFIDEN